MQKNKRSKWPIVTLSIILIFLIGGFTYRFIFLPPLTVVKIQNSDDENMSVNELYLKYQLRMSQYVFQKQYNLSTDSVDTNFWQQMENGVTRLSHLNDYLLDSTKSQLIVLDYAKENNIILEEEDIKMVDNLLQSHSSDEEIRFITEGEKLDEKIFRKIFENLVLSEKAIQIGSNKENLNSNVDNNKVKVVLVEEVVINVNDTGSDTNDPSNIEAKRKLAEKILASIKSGESLESVASKHKIGYKGDLKLSQHDINDDDINKKSIEIATNLKKGEISEVVPIYNSVADDNDIKSFIIFKCINDNIEEDTTKNENEATKQKKEEQFRQSLIDKVNNTEFEINKKLFENLQ